jgi:hypothetical protein
MHAVDQIDIPNARFPEHDFSALCAAVRGMGGAVPKPVVGLDFGYHSRNNYSPEAPHQKFSKKLACGFGCGASEKTLFYNFSASPHGNINILIPFIIIDTSRELFSDRTFWCGECVSPASGSSPDGDARPLKIAASFDIGSAQNFFQ